MNQRLKLLISADGEDALRLYKRVGCAAHALHIDLEIDEKKSDGAPRVFVNGALLIEGMQRTEMIQERLAQWLVDRS